MDLQDNILLYDSYEEEDDDELNEESEELKPEVPEHHTYSFRKNNIETLFQNLTENPSGMEKKDFRLTISTLYGLFEDEF